MKISLWTFQRENGRLLPRLVAIAGVSFVLLLLSAAKIYMDGAHEFNLAENDFAEKEYERAITHYEHVIRWYLPFNSRTAAAVERTWSIGESLEDQKKIHAARTIYQRLRSSLFAIQTIHSPFGGWIERCNRKIEKLSQTSQADNHYNFRPLPQKGWSLCACICLWGWIGLIVGLICLFTNKTSICSGKRSVSWISLAMLVYSGLLVSLAFA